MVWQAELSDNLYASPLAYNHGRFGFIEFNLRGSNQYFDAETNLHYNTNRYFDAKNEKYITPDPLGLAVGPDLYAFGLGQPHTLNDPLGLAPVKATENQFKSYTAQQRVAYIFTYAAYFFSSDVKTALLEMVSPTAIATTAAILGIWAVSQATPYGWVADIALVGIGAFFLGKAIGDLITGIYTVGKAVISSCTQAELNAAGEALRKAVQSIVQNTTSAAAGFGAAKAAKLLRKIFVNTPQTAKKSEVAGTINQKRYGLFNPGKIHSGSSENIEVAKRAKESGRPFFPPWAANKSVLDTWLNPGEKVYMLVDKGTTKETKSIGGWATPQQFGSLDEARKSLALLPEFKETAKCCDVLELTVTNPIPVRSGWAGPLTSKQTGENYNGGAKQFEFLMSMSDNNWLKYFDKNKVIVSKFK